MDSRLVEIIKVVGLEQLEAIDLESRPTGAERAQTFITITPSFARDCGLEVPAELSPGELNKLVIKTFWNFDTREPLYSVATWLDARLE